MAGVKVSNGAGFVPVKDVHVSNGGSFVQAKKVKVSDGAGGWVLTWVPKVPTVTVSFSKNGVAVGEAFNTTATLSIPAPEGTTVQFDFAGWTSGPMAIAEGATTISWVNGSHGAAGSYTWTATAVNLGGTTVSAGATQTVTVAAPLHFHEKVPSGSSGAQIQAAMDRAHNHFMANQNYDVNFDDENSMACVELAASGSYSLGGTVLKTRRGVRLIGGGTGATRPTVTCGGSHFMNVDANDGGLYNSRHYDWVVSNIQINCNSVSGGFSIVHTRRFRIDNCRFYNMGPKKHYIEINSSGGARNDAIFNCYVLACEFQNSSNITGRRVEDECIQFDYSWPGAASNTADDGTPTNNVLIDQCWFHDCPRAIGSHHFQVESGNATAKNYHANILIQRCTFQNVDPSQYNGGDAPNGSGSEGAVRAYCWENVRVVDNTFQDCFQPLCLYINDNCPTGIGNPTYFYIARNYFRGVTQDRPAIYGTSGHASIDFEQILVEDNVADGTWDTSPDIYFVGFDDTRGALAGVSEGVHIRRNAFKPTNISVANQKAYNKYRGENSTNITGVACYGNTVGDGTEDNS